MKTLRFHLFRLILLSLVPVLGFAAIVIGMLHHQMDQLAETGLADTAQALSLVVDREVERLTSTLKALGASEHLRTGDLKAFDRFARDVLAQKPGLENIVLYDQSGRQLINLRVPFGATLPADDARRGQAVSSGGGRAVSNFFHGGLSGRALVQVDISVPGPDDGSPYLLGGSISPKALSEVLLAGRDLPDGTVGTLLDRNGIIITRTSRQEDFVGRAGDAGLLTQTREATAGRFRHFTLDGIVTEGGYGRSAVSGWTVALTVPTSTLDAPLWRSLAWLLSIGAGVVAVSILLAGGVARGIARPILSTSAAAPALVSGTPVDIPASSVSEVREMVRAMTAAGLERKRMENRTAELLRETQQARRSAESLAEVERLISSESLDLGRVGSAIVESIVRLCDARAAALFRVEPGSGDLQMLAAAGVSMRFNRRLPRGTEIAGLAVRDRQPVWTTDVLNDSRITLDPELQAQIELSLSYRAVLAVPLVTGDRVIGALSVGDRAGRVFREEEIALVQRFSAQAAVAMENAQLYQDAQDQLRHTETLLSISHVISSTLDFAELLRRTTRAMVRALGADFGGAWRLTPERDRIIPVAGYRISGELLAGLNATFLSAPPGLADAAAGLTEALYSTDSEHDPRLAGHVWLQVVPHRSVLMIPVRLRGQTLGGVFIAWAQERHEFTDEERRLVDAIAQTAAVGVGNVELLEERAQYEARLETLLRTGQELTRIQPVENVLDRIADACRRLFDSPSVRFWQVEGDSLQAIGTAGEPLDVSPRLKMGQGLAGTVAASGEPLMVLDPATDARVASAEAMRRAGVRTWFGLPIKREGALMGVLSIWDRRESGFSAQDQSIATAFATQAATALENARLYQETRQAYDELRLTKDQLTQSQKMEAIGQLAGGIAHDFNNLLTIIIGRLQLLPQSLRSAGSLGDELAAIEKAGFRAATLTRQLLAFSRKQILQPKVLDLNGVLNEVVPMLKRLIGEDVEFTTRLDPALGRINADPGQLEQVLMNLAVNARDAMPSGGRLTIETANVELDAAFTTRHPGSSPGPHAMLVVSDTGIGMSREIQARIFEPFFTTKEVGKGTGLGLAMVYGIVKQHQGYIGVESQVGRGTALRIYLPRVPAPAESLPASAASGGLVGGAETILLVEDDPEVRQVAREALEMIGYTVLEARDVENALRIAGQRTAPLDLLLSDVVMPGMTGPELAGRIGEMHPEARILYMSGYPDASIARHGVLRVDVTLLQKPFTPDSLARKVREVLSASPRAVAPQDRPCPALGARPSVNNPR